MALDGMYAVQRPMRSLTRTDVMRGPILFHRPRAGAPAPHLCYAKILSPDPIL